ncbi:MAG: hypothetical protein WCC53_02515 [Thermoanaerobaculia bacterium]
MTDLQREFADYMALAKEMHEDVQASLHLFISTNKSAFARRTYVRTFFSDVEAYVNRMKRLLVSQELVHISPLTALEKSALLEEGYDITDQGEVQARYDRYISTDRSMRLLFRAAAKCYKLPYELPVGVRGWQAFRAALKVRHRITHPKAAVDLQVSDSDIDDVQAAHKWFIEVAQELQNGIVRKLTGQDP